MSPAMAWLPQVPERFGDLTTGYGLMFVCTACTRGVAHTREELLQRFGTDGRVSDVRGRFSCSNCKAKRPGRRPAVRVEVFRAKFSFDTEGDRARAKLGPIDRLVWDIERLKPPPIG